VIALYKPWIFLFENLAPRDRRYHAHFLVVLIADALTVSLVPLSSTRFHGVLRFFNFASQLCSTDCTIQFLKKK
jgi:hypothetical protein